MQGMNYLAETTKFADNFGTDWVARFVQMGIPTAILGMATVFVVLALIWGCLEIFKYVFYTVPEKKKASAQAEVKDETVEAVEETATDDGEIVAAIIAAITAMRSDEAAESGVRPSGFRVVSFRKR